MAYALFLGCKIPYYVPQYEISTRAVAAELGITYTEMEFSCCGYPMRHLYFDSYLLSCARNLALAEARGLDLLTPCKCCFGAFKRGQALLAERPDLLAKVREALAEEGLRYEGKAQVRHILQVFYHEVGVKVLKARIRRPFSGLKVAVMYGCHALRPSKITNFDHPYDPVMIDRLVELVGAASVPWDGRLSCCGGPLFDNNPHLALTTIQLRLTEAGEAGAHVLSIACPYSQMQADRAFEKGPVLQQPWPRGSVLYPQLLGLALGLNPTSLGIEQNKPSAEYLLEYMSGA
jgi:heterodisulfide reductase subunit B